MKNKQTPVYHIFFFEIVILKHSPIFIIEDILPKQLSNRLKKVKYDYSHENRMDKSIIFDVKASKSLCDFFIEKFQSDSLTGYIQTINLDPFGFLLMCQYQVFLF